MSDLSKRLAGLSPAKREALARRLQGEAPSTPQRDPIAIIGMACRFPGGADSPEAYWKLLLEGRDAITEVPADRWDADGLYDPDPASPGKLTSKWGGFINGSDRFDAAFFGISPREAQRMDPQQRLLLEVSWEALDDAGQDVDRLAGTATGVFVGLHSSACDYFWMQMDRVDEFDAFTGTGSSHSIASGRLSYLWDLRGPSVVIDTACSSSLVAIHAACQSLRDGESDLVLAGGVNLTPSPLFTIALSRLHMLSPRGRCRTFDAGADGFVRSEGCGIVVLKRLSDAIAAGDNVLAVIRGSAVNQDGRTNGITAPNSLSQQAIIRRALKNADVTPDEIGLVEAHGTGTALGDPIEVEALKEVFGGRQSSVPCALGSAKANLGHLEGAAGVAGLIKAVLSVRHGVYPPLALFQQLNPNISLNGSPFEIPTAPRPWVQPAGPRRASISSFGWSGTNAHMVIEESPAVRVETAGRPGADAIHVLPLSARSEAALRQLAADVRAQLAGDPLADTSLDDVCYTAALRRTHHDYRAAVCGSTAAEICEALDAVARGERRWDVSAGRAVGVRRSPAAFVFCGQGAQSARMGTELLGSAAAFTESLTTTAQLIGDLTGWSLIDELLAGTGESRLDQTEIAQPAIFALQVALVAEWRSRGIVPSTVIGHSVGEIAAAHTAGVITLEDAVRIVVHRAKLMQRTTGYGRMVSVGLSAREAQAFAASLGGRLSLAAENSPVSSVLSGDSPSVMKAVQDLTARGVSARMLPVNYAFHSRQMEPILREFHQAIADIAPRAPQLPIVSTVTGEPAQAGDFTADYWVRNIRETVRFASAIAAAGRSARSVYLEIGPHPVLASSILESSANGAEDTAAVASLQRGRGDMHCLASALGALYAAGCAIEWSRLHPSSGRVMSLPRYPWQRQRYWLPTSVGQIARGEGSGPRGSGSLLGSRVRSPLFDAVVFETRLGASVPEYLRDHRIAGRAVCPAAAYIAMAGAAGGHVLAGAPFELRDILVQQQLELPEGGASRLVQIILRRDGERFLAEICSLQSEETNRWTTHASCAIVPVTAGDSSVEATLIDRVGLSGESVDPAAHYDAFDARGLSFGPAFRCIDALVVEGSAARVDLRLPEDVAPAPELPIHPVVLDGAFHAIWKAMPGELVNDVAYLPFSIERVRIHLPGTLVTRAEARRRRRISAGGETLTGDATLFDARGQLAVEVQGFTMKRVGSEQPGYGRQRRIASWLHEPSWTASPANPAADVPAGDWIVVGDGVMAGGLIARLEKDGHRVGRVVPGAGCASDLGAAIRRLSGDRFRGIVIAFDAPAITSALAGEALAALQASACATVTATVQAVVASGNPPLPPLWLITQGAHQIIEASSSAVPQLNFVHAPVWGLVRALRMELPELRVVAVDVDAAAGAEQAGVLTAELYSAADEYEIAFRSGSRLTRTLVRVESDTHRPVLELPAGSVRLDIPVRGVLENLTVVPLTRRSPGAGEIEIEVKAAGLNFRDVLNALGMYPGDPGPLGNECAGTVIAVGAGVDDLRPGDDVIAIGHGTLGTHVTTSALLAARKPERLSFAEAATIPIAFSTVHEALFAIADLKAGERVLIHAAAGGVGLAAVQMALQVGAEVFATAGSPHKREFLRSLGVRHVMDSRAHDFAREIIDATDGAGVDVVLNSLNGEFIERSLAVVARNGRFVELGKIGIWTPEQVRQFRDDIQYAVLYLGDYFVSDPARIQRALTSLAGRIGTGELQPLPLTTFSLTEAAGAFRYMAQAQHIGKVVLTPGAAATSMLRSDATYLVTGGLGALGLVVADWMVRRGARRVVLASRREPGPAEIQTMERLSRSGARVVSLRCDLSDRDDTAALLQTIERSGPVLRGVIHAAGVLDDGVALQMTRDRFLTVLRPKTAGAWNLHQLTRERPLDFFVMFSSIAGMLGSPGQSNYAAANAFLDALAIERRACGLPATSVSWGPWADAGMAAGTGDRGRHRWAEQGLTAISNEDGLLALEIAMASGLGSTAVLPVDWDRYLSRPCAASLRSQAAHLLEAKPAASNGGRPAALTERLRHVPFGQRRALLVQHVRERASKVLGLAPSFPLDVHQGLRDVGLDSLLAIELRNALQSDVQATLPATLAFDYPTVHTLTAFLSDGPLASVFSAPAPEKTAPQPAAATEQLSQLSDDEAEALLLAELNDARTEERI